MYPKLQFVRLAHNKLTDRGIPPNTFNVSSLVELDLSHNKLEKIPTISKITSTFRLTRLTVRKCLLFPFVIFCV